MKVKISDRGFLAIVGVVFVLLVAVMLAAEFYPMTVQHTAYGKLTGTNCGNAFGSSPIVVFNDNGTDRSLHAQVDDCTVLSTHVGDWFWYTYNDAGALQTYRLANVTPAVVVYVRAGSDTGNNTTSTQPNPVQPLVGLLTTILPVLLMVGLLLFVVNVFLGAFKGHGDSWDTASTEPLADTEAPAPPRDVGAELRSSRVTCAYCGGDAFGTELECPHCGAPAHSAFGGRSI